MGEANVIGSVYLGGDPLPRRGFLPGQRPRQARTVARPDDTTERLGQERKGRSAR